MAVQNEEVMALKNKEHNKFVSYWVNIAGNSKLATGSVI